MANLSKTTRDHDEIRRWAEERGGKPAHVKNTGSADDIGMVRIDFPGYSGEGSLEPISWEEFFEKFDERGLALVYQEETAGGQRSNFNKLVSGETAAESGAGRGRQGRSRSSRSTSGASKTSKSARTAATKGGGSKKAAGSTSGRSSTARKRASSASSKNAPLKKTAARKGGAKKSSSRATAGKKASGKKRSGNRKAAKASAARGRR